ncbi:MAG TPA: NAD(P)-dependent oxidoreductase [Thermoplasmata archaeon]|nr:NAD(P)-dependent oxidoreductase [Thermoplasmata archaeon]
MSAPGRHVLVSLWNDAETRRRIAEALPSATAIAYVSDEPPRPWNDVRALLVGNIRRELPGLKPEDLPALEFVQQIYTGVDDFPFDRIPMSARVAGNVGAYAPFVAEHAVALLLAAARRIPEGHAQTLAGKLRPTASLTYLAGERSLVVGYGEIAQEVAPRLHGLGLEVVGVNRSGDARPGADQVVPIDRLIEELPRARVVINCLPYTRSTAGVFGERAFAAMRSDALFVSVGRAGTTDPRALEGKLRSSPEFRAALDVWWNEEFQDGRVRHPFDLAAYPNLVASPHRAGVVPQARAAVLSRALENMARYLRGDTPHHIVDRGEYVGLEGV